MKSPDKDVHTKNRLQNLGDVAGYILVSLVLVHLVILGAYFELMPRQIPGYVFVGVFVLLPVFAFFRVYSFARSSAGKPLLRRRFKVNRSGDNVDLIKFVIAICLFLFSTVIWRIWDVGPGNLQPKHRTVYIVSTPLTPTGLSETNDLISGFYQYLLEYLPTVSKDIIVKVDRDSVSIDRSSSQVYALGGYADWDVDSLSLTIIVRERVSGKTKWQKDYNSTLEPEALYHLRSTIAHDLARGLGVKVDTVNFAGPAEGFPEENIDPFAYQLFLRAIALFREGEFYNQPRNVEIVALLENAVEIDPDFTAAWARLANAYATSSWFGYLQKHPRKVAKVLERLDTLLGPDHFLTLRTRGILEYQGSGNLIAGRSRLHAAHRMTPTDATTNAYLGFIERRLGETRRAIELHEKVLSVSPSFIPAASTLAHMYAGEGAWNELSDFLDVGLYFAISKGKKSELFLAQLLEEYSPSNDVFFSVTEKHVAYSEGSVLSKYWFLGEPNPDQRSFYDKLLRSARKRSDEWREAGRNPGLGRQLIRRVLIARASLAYSLGDTDALEADLAQLGEHGVGEDVDLSSASGIRHRAEYAMYLLLSDDLDRALEVFSETEKAADEMADRLAAGEAYADLARAAVLAGDADALLRMVEKGEDATNDFSVLAIAMKVPGFSILSKQQELVVRIDRLKKRAAILERIILPHLSEDRL